METEACTPVSVIILTFNEAINIERTLNCIKGWAGEIFIVDSYSTDNTMEIAKRFTSNIYQNPYEYHSQQINWALSNLPISNEWILFLDADEWLTEPLKKEVAAVISKSATGINGYAMKRRIVFMGKWIKHGGLYPTWIIRLIRKGFAKSESRKMDEKFVVDGGVVNLKYDFVDENQKDLSFWITKLDKYASREAEDILKMEAGEISGSIRSSLLNGPVSRRRFLKERVFLRWPLFLRSLTYFGYRYIFRLGFLDGKEGFIYHFFQGLWYRLLVDAKICEVQRDKEIGKE